MISAEQMNQIERVAAEKSKKIQRCLLGIEQYLVSVARGGTGGVAVLAYEVFTALKEAELCRAVIVELQKAGYHVNLIGDDEDPALQVSWRKEGGGDAL